METTSILPYGYIPTVPLPALKPSSVVSHHRKLPCLISCQPSFSSFFLLFIPCCDNETAEANSTHNKGVSKSEAIAITQSARGRDMTVMSAGPVTHQSNDVKLMNGDINQGQYERILNLREEVFAGKHPRLKVPIQLNAEPSKLPIDLPSATPVAQLQNGVHKPASTNHLQVTQNKPIEFKIPRSPVPIATSSTHRTPSTLPAPIFGSSPAAIDPILLTKSEVLVKAELQQKRQRIERALQEQVNQAKLPSRLKNFDPDAIPDFDVFEVLKKAQDIVKPFKSVESNAANRTASSSDSFDENTFYSSQMNESTTEEADGSTKSHISKPCRFLMDGHCRAGGECTFSHDVAVKRTVAADASQAMNVDSVNADEQAILQGPDTSLQSQANDSKDPTSQAQLRRIAELEEQLRRLKSQSGNGLQNVTTGNPSTQRRISEDQANPPPGTRDLAVSQHAGREEVPDRERVRRRDSRERRTSGYHQPSGREYARHNQKSHSPSNEVRVVRNHITSPIAPQPARVSPLAVAKVPQIPQRIGISPDNDRPSPGSGGEVSGFRRSPHVWVRPLSSASSRKRRRESDSNRRDVTRKEGTSPKKIRIKLEQISPPPYVDPAAIVEPRRRREIPPVYRDLDPPRQDDRQSFVYQSTSTDRLPQAYPSDERRPLTPVARRVLSRNAHHFDAHEDQDLRRVVSARQLRGPRSPPEHYAAPQPSSARAASHVYIPQPAQVLSRPSRVQPLSIAHAEHDRSYSPLSQANISPTGLRPTSMAPPRRIVIDQYGQKYFEAPLSSDRQASVIPLGRATEFVSRYEPHVGRSTSVRDHPTMEIYDDRQYRRRAPSPLSPRYVQYHSDPKPRQVFEGESGELYGGEAYAPHSSEVRMVSQAEPRPLERFEDARPREMFARTQSVRPASGQLEEARGHISRVQSVRPEQDRVINLDRRPEIAPYRSRQVSIRDDDAFVRPSRGGVEGAKYRYVPERQERRYVEEFRNEDVVFEAGPGSGRRAIERL